MASSTEIASGALIVTGALGPVGPAMLASVMLVAIETVHRPKGYWAAGGGYEMNVMYLMIALLLATEGYGSFSLDAIAGIASKTRPMFGWLAIGGAIAASVAMLSQRVTGSESRTTRDEMPSREEAGRPA
jgi:putative oxidoreductase